MRAVVLVYLDRGGEGSSEDERGKAGMGENCARPSVRKQVRGRGVGYEDDSATKGLSLVRAFLRLRKGT